MRKMHWMQGVPRYTVTYCQYEIDRPVNKRRMKPTDIFTNHPAPMFRPACENGDPCHEACPRGANAGTKALGNSRERSVIPEQLCQHIVYICEVGLRKNLKTTELIAEQDDGDQMNIFEYLEAME